ncbi:unnamed protein product [Rotaria sp. Silwood1]|nr:unnamed protein product [Rotaria sp. Silwood1]
MLNFNANNGDDSYSSLSDALGESATDETSNNLQQMEDQEINRVIIYHEATISLGDWLILMCFCLFFYQYYDLLLFIFIIHEIINNRNRSTVHMHQSELRSFNLPIHGYYRTDRDAQAEGRVDCPSDETLTFSRAVIVVNNEQLSTEDTQPHDAGVLIGLNNNRPTYFMIDNENGHINENATSYTTMNDDIIAQNLQIGENAQVLNNNDAPETALDNLTCNINPLNSIESQDDMQSSDSSDEEDRILGSESGFDSDDEYDSSDDNEERNQTLENNENLINHVENDNQLDHTNPDNEQRSRTDTLLSHNEPMEMQENVSAPLEGARQTIEDTTYRIPILNQKQTGLTDLTTGSSISKVRIRRGRKFKDEEIQKNIKESQIKDINKNYLHQNEIYEQVDPNNDPDLLQLAKEKKEFFERLGCRFGSPFELANETHFRTYKEARILTRGDRDIIIKRLTEESRRIIPYNLHFLKTFRCNHDIQVITDPWASAEYLFSYVSKDAHMEKNLVYQMSNCTCSSLMEAKAILLKTGNAILSHRQVGKVEASWTVLGIPLYHSSIRCKSLYISLPWEEERILKRGRTHVSNTDDFVESLTHRYIKRPFTPSVINHMTLFEFLTWFDYDRSSSMQLQETLKEPLVENPLWRTDFNQPPLLKTSNFLPRIVLSCGSVLIQHKEPACISFTCRYDDSMLAMYSMLSIGIPYRDPIKEFLGENDLNAIHKLLLNNKSEILQRFSTLPGAYKIQMINAVEHLCDLNAHDFVIKPRTSFIFTTEDEEDVDDETSNNIQQMNDSNITKSNKDSCKRVFSENIDEDDQEHLNVNQNMTMNCPSSRTEELLLSANTQQLFLANFFRQYLAALMRYEESRYRSQKISKPLPFHIVVNGLAGSGKSYVISIIEQMLIEFCISESATRNRPRRLKGLLKMAHTGKAALNIHGWTIHTALGMRPDNTSTPNNAPSFKIHSIRQRLGDLILIIIDEVSLVSYNLFQKVNKRLNEVFEVADKTDAYFGNIPVLLFGDLAQCEPVAAKQIFWRPSGESFSLWSDLFRPINFNINMRQGEDREFFDILCRIRLGIPFFTDSRHDSKIFSGEYNEQDEMKIRSRSIRKEDNSLYYKERLAELESTDFQNAIYAFSVRTKTNERNSIKLQETAMKLKTSIWIIQSIDKVGMARSLFFSPVQASKKACKIDLKPSDDENECASMFEQLPICIGARVICRRNIDFDGKMVNGTEAIIKDIVWDKDDNIMLPMSNRCVFPNLNRALTVKLPKYIELELDNGSMYKMTPEEVSFKDQNGVSMTRKQYPLSLGYAITVHRSQCMTYNKLVVDLTGVNWKPEWCLPNSSDSEQISPTISNTNKELLSNTNNKLISNTNNKSISNCINTKQIQLECMLPITTNSITKPEHVIICEEQEEHFCGRHALRALSQRLDLFSDEYLFDIAENIAATEQICRSGQPVQLTDYYYKYTGDYDIQVLQLALQNTLNVHLLRIDKLEHTGCPIRNLILSNIEHIQAFLIQQDYHYYCLRSFRSTKDYFFKIDSKYSMYHEPIRRGRLFEYLAELLNSNSAIFVIIEHTAQNLNEQITINNIQKALWPLPDAPADFELFPGFGLSDK